MSTRTYADAINHLNSLQSNAAAIEASKASGGRLVNYAMHDTEEYLARIGYSPPDLNKLNVLHVTGTKGKGSTCAFINSILRHAMPQWKIGLFTSPHLVAVRERIMINGKPISEEDFTKYFFEVWDRLEKNTTRKYEHTTPKPLYFRMLTMVAFHAFTELKVDATILEVGVGGMYDCTNIVPKPIVTGVSALGIDHVGVLGKTLKEIAWQKGGIYKEGVPALSVDQPQEGLESLQQQARDRKASIFTVVPLTPGLSDLRLGIQGYHQLQNANLAVHMTREFLKVQAPQLSEVELETAFKEGVVTAKWPGRCQSVSDPEKSSLTWFLDGAHTVDSLECCIQWFVSQEVALRHPRNQTTRVLVFNCTHGRSGSSFLSTILAQISDLLKKHSVHETEATSFFDEVIFCTNITYSDGRFKTDLTDRVLAEEVDPLKMQKELKQAWLTLVPSFSEDRVHVLPSIQDAVHKVRDLESADPVHKLDALVVGSLYLVGGTIEVAGLSEKVF